jgi:hypothetical protein
MWTGRSRREVAADAQQRPQCRRRRPQGVTSSNMLRSVARANTEPSNRGRGRCTSSCSDIAAALCSPRLRLSAPRGAKNQMSATPPASTPAVSPNPSYPPPVLDVLYYGTAVIKNPTRVFSWVFTLFFRVFLFRDKKFLDENSFRPWNP